MFTLPDKYIKFLSPIFRQAVLERSHPARVYWRLAPRVHRLRRYYSSGYVDPPHDPFEYERVNPDSIVRITGREFPHYANKWDLFGVVWDGDWDVRENIPVASRYEGMNDFLYLADEFTETDCPPSLTTTFTETVFHQSMEARFLHGVPWEETPLVKKAFELTRTDRTSSEIWHDCTTPSDVRSQCREIERLYENIKQRGCLSRRKLHAERGYDYGFSKVVSNEILVDVSRDGELLFVDGRHRLSIAKILGLDEVPVVKHVRHKRWIDRNPENAENPSKSPAREHR